jgi:O-antigen ligase
VKGIKVFRALLLSFVFSIPISQFLSARLLIITLVFSLFVASSTANWSRLLHNSWDMLLMLLVLTFGLLYSRDLGFGLKVLEANFCLLSLPIILSRVYEFDEKLLHKIFHFFLYGISSACLICLFYAIHLYTQDVNIEVFFFYKLTAILDFQPTYFAYYLCFAVSIVLYFIYYQRGEYPVWISMTLLLIFFLVLMLTAGRTSYIAMLLVFSFFILKFLFDGWHKAHTKLAFGTSLCLLILMLLINYFDLNTSFIQLNDNNDYWERISLWKSALHATPNIWLGAGTGDYKSVLNEYFKINGLKQYAELNFNSHNQFIQSFFSNGVLGLLSLLLLLGRPLYLSIKNQNVLGIMTFFSFFVYGMTEVFLGRYQGVIFFAFLHQCFIRYYNSKVLIR